MSPADGRVLDSTAYPFAALGDLSSPRLVVFETRVLENIRRLRAELQRIVPQSGFRHLRPHVKTHKSVWTARLQLREGIERFKATPHELDPLIEAGARDVFVAYPLLDARARFLAERIRCRPDVRIAAQIGSIEHARILARAADDSGVRIDCYLDLDVGGHRTGMPPESAPELARALDAPAFDALRLVGLHAYDGHNHAPDPAARRECARGTMGRTVNALRAIVAAGTPLRRLVVSGTPGFDACLRELVEIDPPNVDIEVSPGTWIYWDSKSDALLPNRFVFAVLILARVMDRPGADLITLDLGHKRWGIDQGPVEVFSHAGLEVIGTTEEHTVLRHDGSQRFEIGAPIWIVPRHACSTVNLWEEFTVVREDGGLETRPVSGRNR